MALESPLLCQMHSSKSVLIAVAPLEPFQASKCIQGNTAAMNGTSRAQVAWPILSLQFGSSLFAPYPCDQAGQN